MGELLEKSSWQCFFKWAGRDPTTVRWQWQPHRGCMSLLITACAHWKHQPGSDHLTWRMGLSLPNYKAKDPSSSHFSEAVIQTMTEGEEPSFLPVLTVHCALKQQNLMCIHVEESLGCHGYTLPVVQKFQDGQCLRITNIQKAHLLHWTKSLQQNWATPGCESGIIKK